MLSYNLLIISKYDALHELFLEELYFDKQIKVFFCNNTKQAFEFYENYFIDSVLIEDAPPEVNGQQIVELIRKKGSKVPIFMLLENNSAHWKRIGASYCMLKPIRFFELFDLIKKSLETYVSSQDCCILLGPYVLNPYTNVLFHSSNKMIKITTKESLILRFLYYAGGFVPKEKLLHTIWRYNPSIESHTLETHIYRLRRKIEKDPSKCEILVTGNDGYRVI